MSSDIGAYAESLYQQVLPLHGPDPDGLAHSYIGAVAHPMREVDELVRDTPEGTGWSIILDADAAPVKGLWWLAQLAGVRLRQKKTVTAYNLINYSLPTAGSFETSSDVSSWAYFDAAMTHVLGGTSGNYKLHMRTVTANKGGAGFTIDTGEHARTTFAVDVINSSRAVSLYVEFQDSGFATLSSITQAASTATGRRSITSVSPAGTQYTFYALIMPGALVNETFEMDSARVARGNATDYFDGLSVTRLETDEEWGDYARDAIKRQGGKNRGTPDAIISAAQDTLTGSKVCRLLERVGGNASALELITRPSETLDSDATLAAAMTQKPAGDSLVLTLTEDLLIDEDTGDIDSATGTIDVPT